MALAERSSWTGNHWGTAQSATMAQQMWECRALLNPGSLWVSPPSPPSASQGPLRLKSASLFLHSPSRFLSLSSDKALLANSFLSQNALPRDPNLKHIWSHFCLKDTSTYAHAGKCKQGYQNIRHVIFQKAMGKLTEKKNKEWQRNKLNIKILHKSKSFRE